MKRLIIVLTSLYALSAFAGYEVVESSSSNLDLNSSLPKAGEVRVSKDFYDDRPSWERSSTGAISLRDVRPSRKSVDLDSLEPIEVHSAFIVEKPITAFSVAKLQNLNTITKIFRPLSGIKAVSNVPSELKMLMPPIALEARARKGQPQPTSWFENTIQPYYELATKSNLSDEEKKKLAELTRMLATTKDHSDDISLPQDVKSTVDAFIDYQSKGGILVSSTIRYGEAGETFFRNNLPEWDPYMKIHSWLRAYSTDELNANSDLRNEINKLNPYSKAPSVVLYQDMYHFNQFIGFGGQRVLFYDLDGSKTLVVIDSVLAPQKYFMDKNGGKYGLPLATGRKVFRGELLANEVGATKLLGAFGVFAQGVPKFFATASLNAAEAFSTNF